LGRRPRLEYQGAIYHVIQRGNNREYIFIKPEYKEFIIQQLKKTVRFDGVEMFAYVVMGNHYHLALRTNKEPLSKVMHKVNTNFSRRYNKEQGRTGHVFESRYKAVPIESERYLLSVVRYIHRNPVRAKICASPAEYKWSSDGAYRGRENDFINTELLLDMLGSDYRVALREYAAFMENDDDKDWENMTFIGDESFAMQVEPRQAMQPRKRLDEILMETGLDMEAFKQVKNGSRKRALAKFKAAYVAKALEHGYTFREIGENICISATAAHKLLQKTNL